MSAFELPFNEPYLSVLLNVPPPAAAAASPSRSGSPSALPSTGPPSPAAMADMISTVPPHITRFLVLSAPVLAWARKAAEVLLWRDAHSRAWSWAVVGAWWVACLGGPAMLRCVPALPRELQACPRAGCGLTSDAWLGCDLDLAGCCSLRPCSSSSSTRPSPPSTRSSRPASSAGGRSPRPSRPRPSQPKARRPGCPPARPQRQPTTCRRRRPSRSRSRSPTSRR